MPAREKSELKTVLRFDTVSAKDDRDLMRSDEKRLTELLARASSGPDSGAAEKLRAFMAAGEIQKKKLLAFCCDFRDPTEKRNTVTKNGTEILLMAFLHEDELAQLYRFVERHAKDPTFGDVVYMVMRNHGMTPPQVYNGVLMRRQDFARVTDPRCKNVSRRLAWQIVIGLHCNLQEADSVLFSAGYVRRRIKLDLTMQYFIEHGNYDIEAIDAALLDQGLAPFTY